MEILLLQNLQIQVRHGQLEKLHMKQVVMNTMIQYQHGLFILHIMVLQPRHIKLMVLMIEQSLMIHILIL